MNATGYTTGSAPTQGPTAQSDYQGKAHSALKREYLAYLETKNEEIKEQQDARRYYHGAQYTAEQIKAFKRRRQPVVTYNRIGRKINAVVGLLERQRQDPRGFPRTPQHEEGAEIATAVLRYVMDQQEWSALSPQVGLDGAVDGLGGLEILLEEGDRGDIEVGLEVIDPSSFFYDPRSMKPDFSDARYMGVGKWADVEAAVEMFPDKESEIRASLESGSELTSNPDSDEKWFSGSDDVKRIRIVDHWYLKGGKWHWCIYTGSLKLDEGESYLVDEKGRSECKFIVYSANVDHDGDRYGFIRNMRSSQDEINQRRSKGLHLLNSRRIIMPEGTGANIEKIRTEAARPDGVILYPQGTPPPEFDDNSKAAELNGHLGFLQDAKDEIENYGFNPALMGSGVDKMSGRAMQIQQQAGIAELGPYLLAYKAWKLRVFRAVWQAVKTHWTAERWIRVTDDENVAEFLGINQPATDEMGMPVMDPVTGQQALFNALGDLDVDIIIDEGPDTINMQADAYDTLSMMAQGGQPVPPAVLLELSPLHGSVKKKVMEMLEQGSQPSPAEQAAVMAEIEGKQADVQKTLAEVQKILSEIGKIQSETQSTDVSTLKTAVETPIGLAQPMPPMQPPPQAAQPQQQVLPAPAMGPLS